MNTTPTHRIIDGLFKGKECRIIGGFNNKRKSVYIENYPKNPQLVREELLRPLTRESRRETQSIAQIERNAIEKAFMEVINELASESKHFEGFETDASVYYVKGITLAIQHMSSKIAFHLKNTTKTKKLN